MRRLFVVLLALALVQTTASAQKKGDRNLITRLDIDEGGTGLVTAYDAVQRLRPNWLRPSFGKIAVASTSSDQENATTPRVYINDVRQQAPEDMRTVRIARVTEIKFLEQSRAVQMMGPGHEAGAILITTDEKR